MSMHKTPLTPTEDAGLRAHGLQRGIGRPSQLADAFRQGVAWGITAEREACAKICENFKVPSYIEGAHPDYVEGKMMAFVQAATEIRKRSNV